MAGSAVAATRCDWFDRNLTALRQCQPDIARPLAELAIPPNVTPAVSRDGVPTFRIADGDNGGRWFGRTSVPRVRAQALVDTFAPDNGNTLVSPLGSGFEIKYLLERTPRYCAVLAYEQDLLNIRLALSLIDFSQDIGRRRLILLSGPDLGDAVARFFASVPGYEAPRKMLIPPYAQSGAVESMRVSMEHASSRIAETQSEQVAACSTTLAARYTEPLPPREIVVMSLDPRPACAQAARAIQAAATRMGWPIRVNIPDRPDKCHSLSRIRTLAAVEAAGAVLLNGGWGPLRDHVPAQLCTVSWLLPDAPPLSATSGNDGLGPNHVVFAAAPKLVEAAVKTGVDPRRVELLEAACDDDAFHPLDMPDVELFDVACFADVVDLAPAASGIELASHSALWKGICVEGARRLDATPSEVLEAAQRSSGVTMHDDALCEQLISMIRLRVLPTLVVRAWVQALLDARIDVQVFGHGWQHTRVPVSRVHAPPETAERRNEVYNAARVVVCPVFAPEAVQRCLDVVMAGGCVTLRRDQTVLNESHPQLGEVLETLPACASVPGMLKQVRALLSDDHARSMACDQARAIIADRHLMKHRLTVIRNKLAELSAAS